MYNILPLHLSVYYFFYVALTQTGLVKPALTDLEHTLCPLCHKVHLPLKKWLRRDGVAKWKRRFGLFSFWMPSRRQLVILSAPWVKLHTVFSMSGIVSNKNPLSYFEYDRQKYRMFSKLKDYDRHCMLLYAWKKQS